MGSWSLTSQKNSQSNHCREHPLCFPYRNFFLLKEKNKHVFRWEMSVRLHFSSLAGNNKAEFLALHFLTDCSQQDRDALRGHPSHTCVLASSWPPQADPDSVGSWCRIRDLLKWLLRLSSCARTQRRLKPLQHHHTKGKTLKDDEGGQSDSHIKRSSVLSSRWGAENCTPPEEIVRVAGPESMRNTGKLSYRRKNQKLKKKLDSGSVRRTPTHRIRSPSWTELLEEVGGGK